MRTEWAVLKSARVSIHWVCESRVGVNTHVSPTTEHTVDSPLKSDYSFITRIYCTDVFCNLTLYCTFGISAKLHLNCSLRSETPFIAMVEGCSGTGAQTVIRQDLRPKRVPQVNICPWHPWKQTCSCMSMHVKQQVCSHMQPKGGPGRWCLSAGLPRNMRLQLITGVTDVHDQKKEEI